MVGCTLAAATVLSCEVQPDRWVVPHLAVRTFFDCCRWTCRVTQPVSRTPLRPAFWLPAVEKGRGSKSVEVQRVWEVYDERFQFMSDKSPGSLVHGLSGLVLLRLRLLTLIGSERVLFLAGVWFFDGGVLCFRVVRRGGIRFGRLGVMLLMLLVLLIPRLFYCSFASHEA